MAIIKLGIMVVGISGTVGGVTFSSNKSGPHASLWSRGSNPRTDFQTVQRSTIAAMPQQWRDLTPAEKTAWDVWALLPAQDRINRLGEVFSASGFNWFTIINTRLINMGRATRTGVPTQSRPSAPTVSSLVLPFLPQQATKVTYPSAEFDPDFDQVIEISVMISVGNTVPNVNFRQLLLDQNPPDTDNEFVTPYLERWNLAGASLKGFVRLYRQTTDGLRSAAGTADFVSTDTPPYAATAKDYDGINNFATRGADYTANADSKVQILSAWFRVDGAAGTTRYLFNNNIASAVISLDTGNRFRIDLLDAAAAAILGARTTTTFAVGAAWHNVIWSINLATLTVQLAVDGILETPDITSPAVNANIDYTRPNHSIGAQTGGGLKFNGCMSELYFNNAEFLDITVPSNLARFIDANGFPVDLGNDGAFPTGQQPIVYVRDADPSNNRGYGGNLTNAAALTACSTDPP